MRWLYHKVHDASCFAPSQTLTWSLLLDLNVQPGPHHLQPHLTSADREGGAAVCITGAAASVQGRRDLFVASPYMLVLPAHTSMHVCAGGRVSPRKAVSLSLLSPQSSSAQLMSLTSCCCLPSTLSGLGKNKPGLGAEASGAAVAPQREFDCFLISVRCLSVLSGVLSSFHAKMCYRSFVSLFLTVTCEAAKVHQKCG